MLAHCRALIDAAGPACVAVKPQLACFERLGAPGWLALEHVCAHAQEQRPARARRRQARRRPRHRRGLRAGAGRSTPSPFGPVAGLHADAFTANPLLGRDALAPLIKTAREHTRRRLRARPHLQPGRGRPARPRARHRRAPVGAAGNAGRRARRSGAAGLKDVGAVTGATEPRAPAAAARADARTRRSCSRASAPRAATSARSRPPSPPARPAGSSPRPARSPTPTRPAAPPPDAARAEAERLREQAWGLA